MVSSICCDPDPDRLLAHGTAIVFLPLQSSGEGGRFGFFPAPRATFHNSGRLVGLCGYPFLNQLVSRAAPHATTCCSHVVVSWPSLCSVTRGVTTPAPICLVIQVGTGTVAEREEFLPVLIGSRSKPSYPLCSPQGRIMPERVCLLDPLSDRRK